MLIKLAFRNIFRNFRRTFFTFIAIAIGLALMLMTDSLLQGIDVQSFAKIINYETGHVKIFSLGYQKDKDNLPLDKLITAPSNLIGTLRRDTEVAGVTSRVNFRIMLSDRIDEIPAIGVAINPADDQSVFELKQSIEQGQFLVGSEEAMLIGEKLAQEDPSVVAIAFGMAEEDVRRVMAHPAAMFGSDGLPSAGGKPHPRLYGTFPRVLGTYVRREKVLGLEEAIHKMTELPALKHRLAGRGRLAAGYHADVTVFDARSINDIATYQDPRRYPDGMRWVIVNGEVVGEGGRHTGRGAGRVLRSGGQESDAETR